jgi:hypothetical protein
VERNRLYPKTSPSVAGESTDPYESARREIERAFQPTDKIGEMLCDDLAYFFTKLKRYRRLDLALVGRGKPDALFKILRDHPSDAPANPELLVENWTRGSPEAKAEVSRFLARVGLNEASIEVEAFLQNLSGITALDQLQGSLAVLRDRTLATLALYEEMKQRRLKQDAGNVLDGRAAKVVSLSSPRRQARDGD